MFFSGLDVLVRGYANKIVSANGLWDRGVLMTCMCCIASRIKFLVISSMQAIRIVQLLGEKQVFTYT